MTPTPNFHLCFGLQDSGLYLKELIEPVLTCFNDSDSRLRYYACEALYNIVKVARGAVLPHFNVLFDGLSKVSYGERGVQMRGTQRTNNCILTLMVCGALVVPFTEGVSTSVHHKFASR